MSRVLTITLTLCALLFGASLAMAAPKAPGDLMIGPPASMKATKPLVNFPHARHEAAGVECVTCHHTWDGASAIQGCAAPGCHDQPGKKESNAYYASFHSKSDHSCLGCHKIMKKAGKAVPVGCADCHKK